MAGTRGGRVRRKRGIESANPDGHPSPAELLLHQAESPSWPRVVPETVDGVLVRCPSSGQGKAHLMDGEHSTGGGVIGGRETSYSLLVRVALADHD